MIACMQLKVILAELEAIKTFLHCLPTHLHTCIYMYKCITELPKNKLSERMQSAYACVCLYVAKYYNDIKIIAFHLFGQKAKGK